MENNQSEKYCRKILLLEKLKKGRKVPLEMKRRIFIEGYCWDILFKDDSISGLCYEYAVYTNNRFPKGEPYIMQIPYYATAYAKEFIKGPWPEAEETIARSARLAFIYARDILKGRFPVGEQKILNSTYKTLYENLLHENNHKK